MMGESDFLKIVERAFQSLEGGEQMRFDLGGRLEDMGLDSLAIQQLLMTIEEETGGTLPDDVLERLVEVETLGGFYETLSGYYVAA